MKEGTGGADNKDREFSFISIDRSEYLNLFDYLKMKEIRIKNPEGGSSAAAYSGKARMDELIADLDQNAADDSDGESDDDDYKSGNSSERSADSDDSGVEDDDGDSNDGDDGGKNNKRKSKAVSKEPVKTQVKTQTKKRPKKDKDAPKNPRTAYILYGQHARIELAQDNPSLSMVEVSKMIATKWNALSAEEKAPFEETARKDKER